MVALVYTGIYLVWGLLAFAALGLGATAYSAVVLPTHQSHDYSDFWMYSLVAFVVALLLNEGLRRFLARY